MSIHDQIAATDRIRRLIEAIVSGGFRHPPGPWTPVVVWLDAKSPGTSTDPASLAVDARGWAWARLEWRGRDPSVGTLHLTPDERRTLEEDMAIAPTGVRAPPTSPTHAEILGATTCDRIAAIRARLAAAAPGLDYTRDRTELIWTSEAVGHNARIWYDDGDMCAEVESNLGLGIDGDVMAELLAHAPEDLRWLLELVNHTGEEGEI